MMLSTADLELLKDCDVTHETITELFECESCSVLLLTEANE